MRRLIALVPLALALAGCNDIHELDSPQPSASAVSSGLPGAAPSGEIPASFPELTGDVTTNVRLLSYDAGNRAVIVEPIVFQTGQAFCKAQHVDPIDERCSQDLVTENSNTRVTLPLSSDPDLRDIGDGSPDCLGTIENGATCRATDADLRRLAKVKAAARIALRDGTVVRIAEFYQP